LFVISGWQTVTWTFRESLLMRSRFLRNGDRHFLLRRMHVAVTYGLRAPLLGDARDPIVILVGNATQDFPAHGINLAIHPKKPRVQAPSRKARMEPFRRIRSSAGN
jgi:hypothetical protein